MIVFQITLVCDGCGLRAIGEEKPTPLDALQSAQRAAPDWIKEQPFTGPRAGTQLHKCGACK